MKVDFTVNKGILEKFEELLDQLRRLAAQMIGPICKYFFVSATYCRKKKYPEIRSMLKENRHPVLRKIKTQLTLEITGWCLFLLYGLWTKRLNKLKDAVLSFKQN